MCGGSECGGCRSVMSGGGGSGSSECVCVMMSVVYVMKVPWCVWR